MIEKKGLITAENKKIGVVVSRFNEQVTKKLLEGAYDIFNRLGGKDEDFHVYWVPGAMEIPLILKKLAKKKLYHGLLALGCVIRGETPHFEFVASEVTKGILKIQLDEEIPIAYGIVTVDDLEQALERAGGKLGNRGWEACLSLLEIINLID